MSILQDEWVENTREAIDKLSTHVDKGSMEKLLQVYTLETDIDIKEDLRNEIESIIGVYEPQLLLSERPVIVAPSQDDVSGDIEIGTVFQGDIPVGFLK